MSLEIRGTTAVAENALFCRGRQSAKRRQFKWVNGANLSLDLHPMIVDRHSIYWRSLE